MRRSRRALTVGVAVLAVAGVAGWALAERAVDRGPQAMKRHQAGTFCVVEVAGTVVLLDSATGETWTLDRDRLGWGVWVPTDRLGNEIERRQFLIDEGRLRY